MGNGNGKSLEAWIWDAACSIRGAKDAAKFKEFILPLIFTKRLCDVFDDELNRIAEEVGSRAKAFKLADIIGRSYEYLIRKFAEGSGQSAGEFYTPAEVGLVMARIMSPTAGMEIYDPCCGSAGLLIKCQIIADEKLKASGKKSGAPLRLYGQENEPGTWAMANMNMLIHDMEGEIQIGDTFRNPKFRKKNRQQTFDRVVANPMWNQSEFTEKDYDADELDRL
jgi:type I restriction enzyme M protein